MKRYNVALTIAGSDSGGGAGIQADLKTFCALGCYGTSVITALTAQNTRQVQDILAIPPEFVAEQLEAVFADIKVNAIKTGMLFSASIIEAVVAQLSKIRVPLVIDPVMIAKDGSFLLKPSAIKALKAHLLPLATLLTPNLSETEYLLQTQIDSKEMMQEAAVALCAMGPKAVLIKGGHLNSKTSDDCLYVKAKKQVHWFNVKRIATKNTHGTGCTLSAAITAFLAKGEDLVDAVAAGKEYLIQALTSGSKYRLGGGHGPVHHFYNVPSS